VGGTTTTTVGGTTTTTVGGTTTTTIGGTTTTTTGPTSTTTVPATTTTTTTLPVFARGHHKCYQAKQLKKVCQDDPSVACKTSGECPTGICLQKFSALNVSLADQFETVAVEVKKPKNICPPVEKLPQGPAIQDPNLHYEEYQIKGGDKLARRVLAADQFGVHVLELGKPDREGSERSR
jgi:hypothetical protein